MDRACSASVERVKEHLRSLGLHVAVVQTPQTTRTAAEAAQTLGCTVEQIVKSLVFRGAETGKAYLVVASGANRVDEGRLAALFGEPVAKADAEFVRKVTGFAIGGIPPVGHVSWLETVIDEDLMTVTEMYAAAGSPHHIFAITPSQLTQIVRGSVARIKGVE